MTFWRRRRYSDFSDEVESHIAHETDRLVAEGMRRDDARRKAIRRFGNLGSAKERWFEARRIAWLDSGVRDLRYALRTLARAPAFTCTAVLVVVVAVGGVSVVFTLVNSVLLRPLPFPDSDRLVLIEETNPGVAFSTQVSAGDFLDFRMLAGSFDVVAGYDDEAVRTLDPDGDPYEVSLNRVTPDLFPLLGLRPVIGNPLSGPEGEAGPSGALLSYEFWQEYFGGRVSVLGEQIRLPRGRTEEIVTVRGVMEPRLTLPFYTSANSRPAVWVTSEFSGSPERRLPGFTVVARLRPDVDLGAARAEVETISRSLTAAYPETNEGRVAHVTRLFDSVVSDARRSLWLFFGAVVCVLLVAVANLTSLQIVRNRARSQEIYVRAALGAGRFRLIRQLTAETIVLHLGGGALGLFLAWLGLHLFAGALPERLPRADEIGLDVRAVLVSLAVASVTGLVTGLIPGWFSASGNRLREAIWAGARTGGMRRSRLQRTLIGVETAAALVLLVGAALLANSFWRLFTSDAGMDERNVWTATVELPLSYREEGAAYGFWTDILDQIRGMDGVERVSATLNSGAPLSPNAIYTGGLLPNGAEPDGDLMSALRDGLTVLHKEVMPGYFSTLAIPILRGRPFLDSDTIDADPVVIVNETAGRVLWPGVDALGRPLRGFGRRDGPQARIIGLIPDFVRSLDQEIEPQVYTAYPNQRGPAQEGAVVLRSQRAAAGLMEAVDRLIHNVEPDAEVELASMTQIRWNLVAEERFRTGIMLTFASTALLLALIGVFGIVSYSVVQRRHEVGVRMALGMERSRLVLLMMREAMWPVGVGLVVGLGASLGLTRLLSGFLYQIQPTDIPTFAVSLVCLLLAALAAALLPARQASRVDPMATLRHE